MRKSKSLFPSPKTPQRKGERTRLKVIESAFLCIARDGFYRTTFQTIADHAGISQPLVVRIFGSRENIFPTVTLALLDTASSLTAARLESVTPQSALGKIHAYFEVSIAMCRDNPDLARFYMNIYYLSSYDVEVRKINRKIRAQALERLASLLVDTDLSRARVKEAAHSLHDHLTGFILNNISLDGDWDIAPLKRGFQIRGLK